MVLGLISIILLLFAPMIVGLSSAMPYGQDVHTSIESFYYSPTGIRLLFIYIPSVLFILTSPALPSGDEATKAEH